MLKSFTWLCLSIVVGRLYVMLKDCEPVQNGVNENRDAQSPKPFDSQKNVM